MQSQPYLWASEPESGQPKDSTCLCAGLSPLESDASMLYGASATLVNQHKSLVPAYRCFGLCTFRKQFYIYFQWFQLHSRRNPSLVNRVHLPASASTIILLSSFIRRDAYYFSYLCCIFQTKYPKVVYMKRNIFRQQRNTT